MITSWAGMSKILDLISTFIKLSMQGSTINMPGPFVLLSLPNLQIAALSYSWMILTHMHNERGNVQIKIIQDMIVKTWITSLIPNEYSHLKETVFMVKFWFHYVERSNKMKFSQNASMILLDNCASGLYQNSNYHDIDLQVFIIFNELWHVIECVIKYFYCCNYYQIDCHKYIIYWYTDYWDKYLVMF